MIDNLFLYDIGAFVTIQEATMRLRTIVLISTLVLGLSATPLPVEAQQPGKVYRIGFLTWGGSLEPFKPRLTAFRQGLQELGYGEGKYIAADVRRRSLEMRCSDAIERNAQMDLS